MVRNASLAGLLLAAAGASTTYAATEIGQSVSGFVELAGKQVALPEGSWTLVARSFDDVEELDGDAYGAIETSVLFRLNGQVVEGFVTASRNLAPIEEGWGTASECLAEDVELPLVVQYDAAGAHTFCGFASEVRNVVTASSPDAWREAAEFGRAQGLVPAGEWLMAGYRLSDRYDVLDVRYHFNPALRAAAPPEPMPDAADEDLSEGLGEWLNQMRDSVRVGFYNGLAGIAPMPMPWAEAAEEPSPVTAAKLAKLAVLRETGVLDEVQFKAQQALIVDQKPRIVATPISNEMLTAMKVGAEQVTAAVPTFTGNFLVLQNVAQAGQLLGIQTLVDIVHDFGIEWLWNAYGPQRLREAPTIDLPVAGAIQ
jgi:hypothetical protein